MSKTAAQTSASNKMKTLNALHNPDMFAGGYDVITDFGDGSVNKSIGSQWKSKVGDLDKMAKEAVAKGEGDFKMNVRLKRCK